MKTLILTSLVLLLTVGCAEGPRGSAGTNGTDGQDSIIEVIRLCPERSQEILLRLSSGELVAHYSDGKKQFLVALQPGNYVTTDGTNCRFTVDKELNVSWQ